MISLTFFGILVISLILYWLLPSQRLRNYLLVVSSFAFIFILDKWSVAVVVGLTAFSYLFGCLIARNYGKGYLHFIGVSGVLAALIVFKYLGFLAGILNSLSSFVAALPTFHIDKLLLPLGISYIVFKHISYLTDIKWGLTKPGKFIDFLLYSSLFTIYVAGPIERFERFNPQVEGKRIPFAGSHIEYGITRIVFGLFKKLVLADWLGYFIYPIWEAPGGYSLVFRALALVGYSFQIYFDFAAYSDIAIGSSQLFGLTIMENFKNPYLAPNISQFWRRWHISLSDWIRDYIFFPLSRLFQGKAWTMLVAPVIAMSLCGLWHGPKAKFMVWGIWHGLGLAAYQSWNAYSRKHKQTMLAKIFKTLPQAGTILNFMFVTLGWLVFRLRGQGLLRGLLNPAAFFFVATISGAAILVHYLMMRNLIEKINFRFKAALAAVCTILFFCMMSTNFIYAQF